eukprot:TRINITY_DN4037_c0_g1_i5.p1 TRINITY_DN4037_c0_g1~~TRINITY_DN4037_c0_g1_i5.p1  ORF type:complete len:303 (-),score=16.87 TRINITY_DN4037_c0_g1_i5:111-1019(-)
MGRINCLKMSDWQKGLLIIPISLSKHVSFESPLNMQLCLEIQLGGCSWRSTPPVESSKGFFKWMNERFMISHPTDQELTIRLIEVGLLWDNTIDQTKLTINLRSSSSEEKTLEFIRNGRKIATVTVQIQIFSGSEQQRAKPTLPIAKVPPSSDTTPKTKRQTFVEEQNFSQTQRYNSPVSRTPINLNSSNLSIGEGRFTDAIRQPRLTNFRTGTEIRSQAGPWKQVVVATNKKPEPSIYPKKNYTIFPAKTEVKPLDEPNRVRSKSESELDRWIASPASRPTKTVSKNVRTPIFSNAYSKIY